MQARSREIQHAVLGAGSGAIWEGRRGRPKGAYCTAAVHGPVVWFGEGGGCGAVRVRGVLHVAACDVYEGCVRMRLGHHSTTLPPHVCMFPGAHALSGPCVHACGSCDCGLMRACRYVTHGKGILGSQVRAVHPPDPKCSSNTVLEPRASRHAAVSCFAEVSVRWRTVRPMHVPLSQSNAGNDRTPEHTYVTNLTGRVQCAAPEAVLGPLPQQVAAAALLIRGCGAVRPGGCRRVCGVGVSGYGYGGVVLGLRADVVVRGPC